MKINLYIRWAFTYFLLIAILGSAMRWAYVYSPFFEYKHILHTHSHIALLGWVYIGLTTLIAKQFLERPVSRKYKKIFWATQITISGMLFSFPFQGYGLYSIIFSTLFLIVSYIYACFVIKNTSLRLKGSYAYKWIRLALWCMVLSSIGPWALGYIMTQFGRESSLYKGAIYFYMHFQYNGWMLTALIGLFLRYLEQKQLSLNYHIQKKALWLFGVGIFLTLPLSWVGLVDVNLFYLIGGVGVGLQITAITLLIREFLKHEKVLPNSHSWLFKLIIILFFAKLGMQSLSSIPWVAERTFFNIDMVIGYLHFIFLGIISLSLLYFLLIYKEIKIPKWAILFFISVFFATEFLIFYKGFALFFGYALFVNYFKILAIFSSLFLIPAGVFFVQSFRRNNLNNISYKQNMINYKK